MQLEFRDSSLAQLAYEAEFDGGYDRAIVRAFRKRVQAIDAARDERDLRAVKGNHFEKLKGDRSHQYSLRLNGQWRLIIELQDREGHKACVLVAIEDYH